MPGLRRWFSIICWYLLNCTFPMFKENTSTKVLLYFVFGKLWSNRRMRIAENVQIRALQSKHEMHVNDIVYVRPLRSLIATASVFEFILPGAVYRRKCDVCSTRRFTTSANCVRSHLVGPYPLSVVRDVQDQNKCVSFYITVFPSPIFAFTAGTSASKTLVGPRVPV